MISNGRRTIAGGVMRTLAFECANLLFKLLPVLCVTDMHKSHHLQSNVKSRRRAPVTESSPCRLTVRRVVAGRPSRRDSVEHALYAYVFVNLRPAYPRTAADDLEFCTLLGGCLGESPGPNQRNTNCQAVHQLGSNRVLSDRNTLNAGLDVSRNAHAKPPKS